MLLFRFTVGLSLYVYAGVRFMPYNYLEIRSERDEGHVLYIYIASHHTLPNWRVELPYFERLQKGFRRKV